MDLQHAIRKHLPLVAGLVLLIPSAASSQATINRTIVEEEVLAAEAVASDSRRQSCQSGADRIAAGEQGAERISAIWDLRSCELSGVEPLLQAWSEPIGQSEFSPLLHVTYSIRDRRLLALAMSLAADERMDKPKRFGALSVVSSFLDARSGKASPQDWFPYHPEELMLSSWPVHHTTPVRGLHPINRIDVEGLEAPLSALAEDSDVQIRIIARHLLQLQAAALRSWADAGSPFGEFRTVVPGNAASNPASRERVRKTNPPPVDPGRLK